MKIQEEILKRINQVIEKQGYVVIGIDGRCASGKSHFSRWLQEQTRGTLIHMDTFQGPVAAKFATEELKAQKAAVLYDIASDYPKGLAEDFKAAFEKLHGPGSVVAFETFTTKDVDFSAQLTNIVKSGADVLFVPQYYNEVPLIVKQAKALGFNKPLLGSDSWGSGDLMGLCGDDCKGYYFVTHYAAAGAKGKTKDFIDEYTKLYKKTPDDVAALTWDSTNLVLQAIQSLGTLSGDLAKDREALMGLAPLLMYEMFRTLKKLNELGLTILLIEQNAKVALSFAHRGYVLDTGEIKISGTAEALRNDPDVKKAYLGG